MRKIALTVAGLLVVGMVFGEIAEDDLIGYWQTDTRSYACNYSYSLMPDDKCMVMQHKPLDTAITKTGAWSLMTVENTDCLVCAFEGSIEIYSISGFTNDCMTLTLLLRGSYDSVLATHRSEMDFMCFGSETFSKF